MQFCEDHGSMRCVLWRGGATGAGNADAGAGKGVKNDADAAGDSNDSASSGGAAASRARVDIGLVKYAATLVLGMHFMIEGGFSGPFMVEGG